MDSDSEMSGVVVEHLFRSLIIASTPSSSDILPSIHLKLSRLNPRLLVQVNFPKDLLLF